MNERIIYKKVESTSRRFPNNIALDTGQKSITYKELNRQANCVAHALIQFGVIKNSVVGIYLDASIDYVIAMLGVLKAGAIFAPLDTGFPEKRLKAIMEKIKPCFFITNISLETDFCEKYKKLDFSIYTNHTIIVDDQFNFQIRQMTNGKSLAVSQDYPCDDLPLRLNPDDGCYIMTTSGSTGEPKAILGTHKGLSHFIDWEIAEFNLNKPIQIGLIFHITFDASLRDIFIPLCTGGTLYIPDDETKSNPKNLVQWLCWKKINIIHTVPTIFRLLMEGLSLLKRETLELKSLEYILISGEPLYWDDVKKWNNRFNRKCELVNFYGPSETTLIKVFYRINNKEKNKGEMVPLGKPLPETEIYLINEGKECKINEIGEIHIKTDYMTNGYYNNLKQTKESFINNPITKIANDIVYKTGDLGYVSNDGNLHFAGRLDNQIKLHGRRIEIGEIEMRLRNHPAVVNAAVVLGKLQNNFQELICYIEQRKDSKLDNILIKKYLKKALPYYMIPNTFTLVEDIPLLPNGKINRKKLAKHRSSHQRQIQENEFLQGDIEQSLYKIWKAILNRNNIGAEENFFEIGGDSVKAMQIIMMIDKIFKLEIPVVKVFEYPTIKSLSKFIINHKIDVTKKNDHLDRARNTRNAFKRRKLKVT